MSLDTRYYIHTEADGVLGETAEADVRLAVDALVDRGLGVLHFHGGLVGKPAGMGTAARLQPEYQAAGAHPIFFVWESGFIETITGNLREIFREDVFDAILAKVMKWVVGDLMSEPAARSPGQMRFPRDWDLSDELGKRDDADKAEEPYADLEAPADLPELTPSQLEAFARDLANDGRFNAAARAVAASALPEEVVDSNSRGVTATVTKSTKTLMSPEVVDELVADTDAGSRGVFTTAKMVLRAAKALIRIIERLRSGRDHGPYTTVVEELLREFYVANIGAEVWRMMKSDTNDTFQTDPQGRRGGELLLRVLGERAQAGALLPPIDLIGHSTGAVFICHLLAATEEAAADSDHPLPTGFTFRNVAFLAPACSYVLFREILWLYGRRFSELRVFAMSDEREALDRLLPGPLAAFYPRSLLYFVSGVVERTSEEESAPDLPLLGMERYVTRTSVYSDDAVSEVRAFLEEHPKRVVWAPADRGPGLACDARDHGGLDNDPLTLGSLRHMIESGW